ncbi:MAG: hypothetical protein KAJ05_04175 [Candidatus Latescibacteria bacterium]|nr:hypothetical protein [Candidatus Latescibacterota bacterium]
MTKLEALKWKPMWVTHLGCLQGCLNYLGVHVSDAWLFGASGHAFILNMHEVVCPSGPTAWDTERMPALFENVGCELDGVSGHKSQDDFPDKQKMAWEKVRSALESDFPCYGWELDIPEFYVIHGYDDTGYYFNGPLCDSGKGPLPWRKLGDTEIGALEVIVVRPGKPASPEQTVRQALNFALEHSGSPEKWIFPKYQAGLAGYDLWIEALLENKAHGFGTAYNAVVWAECRRFAADFLREAKARLDGSLHPLFDEAILHYTEVSRNLGKVSETFPFLNIPDEVKEANMKDESRRRRAVEALTAGRSAEGKGLRVLKQIAAEL